MGFILTDVVKTEGNELGQNEAAVNHRPRSTNPNWAGKMQSNCSFFSECFRQKKSQNLCSYPSVLTSLCFFM